MNIAILGAGRVGSILGTRWAKTGHTIRFGVRNIHKPETQELIKSIGANASASSLTEAIAFGEIVVFAITGSAMEETIAEYGKALDGKLIIDSTNNFRGATMNNMAAFAAHAPKAKVVRAFNIYGTENFDNPTFGDVAADLFYCGPAEAQATIDGLISEVGLNPMYVGGPDQVELIDNLLRLWYTLANVRQMGRNVTFKVLTR